MLYVLMIFILCNIRTHLGHLGLSTVQKCITELEMLAYGIATNATNEYCHMDERIMTKCFKCFVKEIFEK
jgi:hypothetical protein